MGRKLRLAPLPTRNLAWAGINKYIINPVSSFLLCPPNPLTYWDRANQVRSENVLQRWAGELLPPLHSDKATGLASRFFGGLGKSKAWRRWKLQDCEGPWGSELTDKWGKEAAWREGEDGGEWVGQYPIFIFPPCCRNWLPPMHLWHSSSWSCHGEAASLFCWQGNRA